jgi:hypothetical protein
VRQCLAPVLGSSVAALMQQQVTWSRSPLRFLKRTLFSCPSLSGALSYAPPNTLAPPRPHTCTADAGGSGDCTRLG